MNSKLQWLRNTMSSLDLQGLIISNPVNIKYLTGIEAEGVLLITRKENVYITMKKYFIEGNQIFFNFLTSQIIDAIIVGVLVSIAMAIIGVKYAVLLGFVIGLFNLIPYFGAIVAVAIAILITLFTGGIGKAILMAAVVIVLQQIDANIINPKIVGNSLQISQLLVLFAVTVGGAYFGILGMFLSVPIFTVIKVIIEDFVEEREEFQK